MEHPGYTIDEIAERGEAIYRERLRAKLEKDNIGMYLVIDIETGEYEIDSDDVVAAMRAFDKNPDGVRYELRIGFDTSGTIGSAGATLLGLEEVT